MQKLPSRVELFLVFFVLFCSISYVIVFIDCVASEVSRSYQTAIKASSTLLALKFKIKWQWLALLEKHVFYFTEFSHRNREKFLPFRKGKVVTSHHAWQSCNWIESKWRHERLVACITTFSTANQPSVPGATRFASHHWPLKESIRCPSMRRLSIRLCTCYPRVYPDGI